MRTGINQTFTLTNRNSLCHLTFLIDVLLIYYSVLNTENKTNSITNIDKYYIWDRTFGDG